MRAIAAILLSLWGAAVMAASFSSGSFSTDSFSTGSFDFGGGPAQVAVPDCTTSLTLGSTCVSDVEAAGLVATTTTGCSDIASGYVTSTDPAAGTMVDVGSTVSIRISNGSACAPAPGAVSGLGVGGLGVGM